jgi:hypothetical protein
MDLERVPLGTGLGLLLNQVQLGFRVEGDGTLVVTCDTAIDGGIQLMDEASLGRAYQTELYGSFHERKQAAEEARERRRSSPAEAPHTAEGGFRSPPPAPASAAPNSRDVDPSP